MDYEQAERRKKTKKRGKKCQPTKQEEDKEIKNQEKQKW